MAVGSLCDPATSQVLKDIGCFTELVVKTMSDHLVVEGRGMSINEAIENARKAAEINYKREIMGPYAGIIGTIDVHVQKAPKTADRSQYVEWIENFKTIQHKASTAGLVGHKTSEEAHNDAITLLNHVISTGYFPNTTAPQLIGFRRKLSELAKIPPRIESFRKILMKDVNLQKRITQEAKRIADADIKDFVKKTEDYNKQRDKEDQSEIGKRAGIRFSGVRRSVRSNATRREELARRSRARASERASRTDSTDPPSSEGIQRANRAYYDYLRSIGRRPPHTAHQEHERRTAFNNDGTPELSELAKIKTEADTLFNMFENQMEIARDHRRFFFKELGEKGMKSLGINVRRMEDEFRKYDVSETEMRKLKTDMANIRHQTVNVAKRKVNTFSSLLAELLKLNDEMTKSVNNIKDTLDETTRKVVLTMIEKEIAHVKGLIQIAQSNERFSRKKSELESVIQDLVRKETVLKSADWTPEGVDDFLNTTRAKVQKIMKAIGGEINKRIQQYTNKVDEIITFLIRNEPRLDENSNTVYMNITQLRKEMSKHAINIQASRIESSKLKKANDFLLEAKYRINANVRKMNQSRAGPRADGPGTEHRRGSRHHRDGPRSQPEIIDDIINSITVPPQTREDIDKIFNAPEHAGNNGILPIQFLEKLCTFTHDENSPKESLRPLRKCALDYHPDRIERFLKKRDIKTHEEDRDKANNLFKSISEAINTINDKYVGGRNNRTMRKKQRHSVNSSSTQARRAPRRAPKRTHNRNRQRPIN